MTAANRPGRPASLTYKLRNPYWRQEFGVARDAGVYVDNCTWGHRIAQPFLPTTRLHAGNQIAFQSGGDVKIREIRYHPPPALLRPRFSRPHTDCAIDAKDRPVAAKANSEADGDGAPAWLAVGRRR